MLEPGGTSERPHQSVTTPRPPPPAAPDRPVHQPQLLEVPGQPPAGDMGAGVGRAADDPHRPDRVADRLEPGIVAREGMQRVDRQAGSGRHHPHIGPLADPEPLAVQPCPAALEPCEHLVPDRGVERLADHAELPRRHGSRPFVNFSANVLVCQLASATRARRAASPPRAPASRSTRSGERP